MIEVWKPIEGTDGMYEVSNTGKVRSKRKELSWRKDRYGYAQVCIYINGKSKHTTIHRLVAKAFIPNPENLPQVNHINGVKTDNNIENLEWCTVSQNIKHAFDIGLKEKSRDYAREQSVINNIKLSKAVIVSDKDGIEKTYKSVSEACRQLSVNRRNAQAVLNGTGKSNRQTAGGYKWRYATEKGGDACAKSY